MQNNKPKVSVIIPTYNRAHFVCGAVQSVLNQTYQDFEIIVVDDASSDNTREVLSHFKNEKLIYIQHDNNKGATAARNTGISVSQGDYIGFLDDDDEWLPEKLEKQINKFLSSPDDTGLIYSGFYYISNKSNGVMQEVHPVFKGDVHVELLKKCICGSPTPLIKKECFEKAGYFDETLLSCQDWDMWIRISKYYMFDFVPEILAKHRVHGKQMSTDLNKKILARKRLLEKYHLDFCKHPSIFSINLKRLGILCCLADNSTEGRKYLIKSIKRYFFQIDGFCHFGLSLLLPKIHRRLLQKYSVTNIDDIIFYY